MIEPKVKSTVVYSELKAENTFKIELSEKAFHILSSQLYKHKIRAIIRELGCNAVDAHIEAGNTEDFEVKLPTRWNQDFWIRDFGTGISDDNMREVFTVLFKSTKDNSNNFTGMLGLGCKSPFSYTECFTVTSYQNGIETVYFAVMNQQKVPTIDLILKQPTEEKNGLKISFSVHEKDNQEFHQEAKKVFSTFFGIKPRFIGANFSDDLERDKFIAYDSGRILIDTRTRSSSNLYALQGNIAYPVERSKLKTDFFSHYQFDNDLYVHVDIGEITFTPAREEIEDTDRNYQVIDKYLDSLILRQELESKIDKYIEHVDTQYKASLLAESTTRYNLIEKLGFFTTEIGRRVVKKGFIYSSNLEFKEKDLKQWGFIVEKFPKKKNLAPYLPLRARYKTIVYLKENVTYSASAIRYHYNCSNYNQAYIFSDWDNYDKLQAFLEKYGEFIQIYKSTDLIEKYGKEFRVSTAGIFRTDPYGGYKTAEEVEITSEDSFFFLFLKREKEFTIDLFYTYQSILKILNLEDERFFILRRSDYDSVRRKFPHGKDIEEFFRDYLINQIGKKKLTSFFKTHLTSEVTKGSNSDLVRQLLSFIDDRHDYPYKSILENVFKTKETTGVIREILQAVSRRAHNWKSRQHFEDLFGKYKSSYRAVYKLRRRNKKIQQIIDWYTSNFPEYMKLIESESYKYNDPVVIETYRRNFQHLLEYRKKLEKEGAQINE